MKETDMEMDSVWFGSSESEEEEETEETDEEGE